MHRFVFGHLTAAALAFFPVLAGATAQRTFVSSQGVDNPSCSLVAPCRQFAAAVAATSAGGEVIVMDSAGYGPVTITKSVSIVSPTGVYAGISVFTGAGVVVNGSGISVVLRGLSLVGQGGIGLAGIRFLQGAKLTVLDCDISRMDNYGIYASAPGGLVTVKSSTLRENFIGFLATSTATAALDDVHVYASTVDGVSAGAGAKVTVTNSVITDSGGDGVYVYSSGTEVTDLMVTGSTIGRSTNNIHAFATFGGTTRVVVDNCAINEAVATAFLFDGGIIYTLNNNRVGFNNGIVTGGSLTVLGLH